MVKCQVCTGKFHDSPDRVILCAHHQGPVHLGCCVEHCSLDGKPCEHSHGEYEKQD